MQRQEKRIIKRLTTLQNPQCLMGQPFRAILERFAC